MCTPQGRRKLAPRRPAKVVTPPLWKRALKGIVPFAGGFGIGIIVILATIGLVSLILMGQHKLVSADDNTYGSLSAPGNDTPVQINPSTPTSGVAYVEVCELDTDVFGNMTASTPRGDYPATSTWLKSIKLGQKVVVHYVNYEDGSGNTITSVTRPSKSIKQPLERCKPRPVQVVGPEPVNTGTPTPPN